MALFFGLAFLLLCFGAGKTKQLSDEIAFMPNLPTHVEVVGDEVYASTASGSLQRWNPVAKTWEGEGDFLGMATVQSQGIRIIGPIYDGKKERLLRLDSMSGSVLAAELKLPLTETSGANLPPGTIDIKRHPDGTFYFIAGHGVSRFAKKDGKKETIESCSPTLRCGMLAYVAIHPVTGEIAICGGGRLVVLTRTPDGAYAVKAEKAGIKQRRLVVGFLDDSIVGVDEKGVAHVFDANLEETASLEPVRNEVPRSMTTSLDGQTLYMLYHNQELWAMNTAKPSVAKKATVSGQGSITGATVLADGRLAIGWDLNRVTVYDKSLKPEKTYRPKMGKFETAYRFGIVPLYTVFPKPTEISNFTAYVITGKLSHQHGRDASVFRPRINVWQPIWSCAIFVVVVIGIGCHRLSRRDF